MGFLILVLIIIIILRLKLRWLILMLGMITSFGLLRFVSLSNFPELIRFIGGSYRIPVIGIVHA